MSNASSLTKAPCYVLKIACDNRPGIVAAVAGCIAANGGDILEASQFDDTETGQFLMRVYFSTFAINALEFDLKPVIERFAIRHELIPETKVGRVLILVSKMDHCLHDLLYRWRNKSLNMDMVGVVSNHRDCEELARFYGIPFHCLPVTKDNKPEQEAKLLELVASERVDLVVLARYMQILSDELTNKLYGKVINIHHSFLPSFKGARPYHQAHARGVKLTGATIEQEIARVSHSDTIDDLVSIGRDTEARVLARSVGWHLEHRVFLNQGKTVVFN